MALNLEIIVDHACLHRSFDPLEGFCCKTLSVQLKFGFGSHLVAQESSVVSTRTGDAFSYSNIVSMDIREQTAKALRVELWLIHRVRSNFLCGAAALPWLLQVGRKPPGVAHMVATELRRGSSAIGKLTLQLTLRVASAGLSEWHNILTAQLKDMVYDARWARYQQDTALKGPVCSCGVQMISLMEVSGALACRFCGTPARLPAHTWEEGKTWRVTKEELFLDAFQVCRKCFHAGQPCCYCARCATEFGAGRQLMCIEPDTDTADQLLKAGCGSLDLAYDIASRLHMAFEAHRFIDTVMPPMDGPFVDDRLAVESFSTAHIADTVSGDDIPQLCELASWDADGRRLSQKIAWLVKTDTCGSGALVRAATRVILRSRECTQKCIVDDVVELAEMLEARTTAPAATSEFALAALAWHGSRYHDFPEMARRLNLMRLSLVSPGELTKLIWSKVTQRVHDHVMQKLTEGKPMVVKAWLDLVSMTVGVDVLGGRKASADGGNVRTWQLLLLSTPPAVARVLGSLLESPGGKSKVTAVVHFFSAASEQILRLFRSFEEESEGGGVEKLAHVFQLLSELPQCLGERWIEFLQGLAWLEDPAAAAAAI